MDFLHVTSCSWWNHQMETFFALLALCEGNPPITRGFPSQRPVARSFDVLMCSWRNGWANTLDAGDLRRHSTWRHCNVLSGFTWHDMVTVARYIAFDITVLPRFMICDIDGKTVVTPLQCCTKPSIFIIMLSGYMICDMMLLHGLWYVMWWYCMDA